jgi:hypothetical protein
MDRALAATAGARPERRSAREIGRNFRALVRGGARLLPAGAARRDPDLLLRRYLPRHAVALFDAVYFLTDLRFEEGLRFFVGYLGLPDAPGGPLRRLYPRIFYKDSSLMWRVASHVIRNDGEDWIGKGDVKWVREGEHERLYSDEDTTNLPYEVQAAFDAISRRRPPRRDDVAVRLVLRKAPSGRIEPYADFNAQRRALHGGRRVARVRRGDPRTLRFERGFEPDFARVIETSRSRSRLYGGIVRKFRVLSLNERVQYQFAASPTHVWINPPQALTRELTIYGVRCLHVAADDEIFVPGYEYHVCDEHGVLHSQIPHGYAGRASPIDPERADAAPWIEELPVIREFRRRVLEP